MAIYMLCCVGIFSKFSYNNTDGDNLPDVHIALREES